MRPVLERELVFVTGKGGVGRTTVCAALGLVAAGRGKRTIVCELGEAHRLPQLFGVSPHGEGSGDEVALAENLWAISMDPQVAMRDYLATQLPGPFVRFLSDSRTFGYLYAAAPGAQEVATLGGVWDLLHGKLRDRTYEMVIVDAPATGHALGLIRAPRTIGEIARVGPVRNRADRIRGLLRDTVRTTYAAVTTLGEIPVSETLELSAAMAEELGRPLELVVANGVYPRRFSGDDLEALAGLDGEAGAVAAVAAARSQADRVRTQQRELARLRRNVSGTVTTLPYLFEPRLDLEAVQRLAAELDKRL